MTKKDVDKIKKEIRRRNAGWAWFIIGFFLFVVYLYLTQQKMIIILFTEPKFYWCAAWTSIGIGAGLINTRDHTYTSFFSQHVLYCGFIFVVILLLSVMIPLIWCGSLYMECGIKFYCLSALIGLIGGFLGDIFRDLVIGWLLKIVKSLNKEDENKVT